jgi:hypothetical protein
MASALRLRIRQVLHSHYLTLVLSLIALLLAAFLHRIRADATAPTINPYNWVHHP